MPVMTVGTGRALLGATRRYFLLDNFLTDQAAPLASPHYAEPGPGVWTKFGAGGTFHKIEDDTLKFDHTTFDIANWCSQAIVIGPGVALHANVNPIATGGVGAAMGWRDTPNTGDVLAPGLYKVSGQSSFSFGATTNYWPITVNNFYRCIIVLAVTHAFLVVRNLSTLAWEMAYPYNSSQSGTRYATLRSVDGRTWWKNVYAAQMGGALASDYAAVVNRVVSPADGEVSTNAANGHTEITWTPAALEVLDLKIRCIDDDNCISVRCDQAAGTIRVYRREAGVDTELTGGTTTQVWTAGTPYRVLVTANDTLIKTTVANVTKNSTTSNYNQTETGVKVSGFTTGSNLICWPIDVSAHIPGWV